MLAFIRFFRPKRQRFEVHPTNEFVLEALMGFISPKTFVVTTILMVGVAYAIPDILPQRFSRKVIRFLIYDGLMAVIYTLFIYPFCFNPLRHLPGPTVSYLHYLIYPI